MVKGGGAKDEKWLAAKATFGAAADRIRWRALGGARALGGVWGLGLLVGCNLQGCLAGLLGHALASSGRKQPQEERSMASTVRMERQNKRPIDHCSTSSNYSSLPSDPDLPSSCCFICRHYRLETSDLTLRMRHTGQVIGLSVRPASSGASFPGAGRDDRCGGQCPVDTKRLLKGRLGASLGYLRMVASPWAPAASILLTH